MWSGQSCGSGLYLYKAAGRAWARDVYSLSSASWSFSSCRASSALLRFTSARRTWESELTSIGYAMKVWDQNIRQLCHSTDKPGWRPPSPSCRTSRSRARSSACSWSSSAESGVRGCARRACSQAAWVYPAGAGGSLLAWATGEGSRRGAAAG